MRDKTIPEKKKLSLREIDRMKLRLSGLNLNTICIEALCPNVSECFSRGQATFLILGRVCTRNCVFCNVTHGCPSPPDSTEPSRVAEAVRRLRLRHVVLTSPTRDDLPDGGAAMFVAVLEALRRLVPCPTVELLIPDFGGDPVVLRSLANSRPEMIGHNLETVRRLYPRLRPGKFRAAYDRSLGVLRFLRECDPSLCLKSALMLGLGETEEEVEGALEDLLTAGCRYLSLGQYLAPSRRHHPVARHLDSREFVAWRRRALSLGFRHVESGKFVRSSYHAEAHLQQDSGRESRD